MKKTIFASLLAVGIGATSSAVAPRVIFSSIVAPADLGTNVVPGYPGATWSAPTATSASRILDGISPSSDFSRWVGVGRIEAGTTDEDCLTYGQDITSGTFNSVLRENTAMPVNGFLVDDIKNGATAINNAGLMLFGLDDTNTASSSTLDDHLMTFDGTNYTLVHSQLGAAPNLSGMFFQGAFATAALAGSDIWFGNTAGATSGAARQTFYKNSDVQVRATVTVPTGQAAAGTSTLSTMTAGSLKVDATGTNTAYVGTLTSPASTTVLVYNGDVKIQRNQVLPGSGFTSLVNTIDVDINMAPNGNYMARGSNVDGQDWVVKNGAVVAQKGAPVIPGSTINWDDAAFSAGFFMSMTNNFGETIVGGLTTDTNPAADAYMVAHGRLVFLKEGDEVDLTGDGVGDGVFISTFNDDNGFLTDNLYWYFSGNLKDGAGNIVGNAFMRYPVPILGDVDGDDEIGSTDFDIIVANFGNSPATYAEGDVDGDGEVGSTDFDIVVADFGRAR